MGDGEFRIKWRDLEVGFDDRMRVCIKVKGDADPDFIDHMVSLGFTPGENNDVIVGVAEIDEVAKKVPPEPPPPNLGRNDPGDQNVEWVCEPLQKACGREIGDLEDKLEALRKIQKIFEEKAPLSTTGGNGGKP